MLSKNPFENFLPKYESVPVGDYLTNDEDLRGIKARVHRFTDVPELSSETQDKVAVVLNSSGGASVAFSTAFAKPA